MKANNPQPIGWIACATNPCPKQYEVVVVMSCHCSSLPDTIPIHVISQPYLPDDLRIQFH